MKPTNDILSKVNHRQGLTVPDGYFADFNKRMADMLPPQEWEQSSSATAAKKTFWMKIRPYVYMAAMFAGVWLMMNMFDMMRPADGANLAIDKNPVLTAAVENENFMNDYYLQEFDDYDLMEEMVDDGTAADFAIDDLNENEK